MEEKVKKIIWFFALALAYPTIVGAQELSDFSHFSPACAPERIVWQEAKFFGNFSPGGVSDLPDNARIELRRFVDSYPNRNFFFVGTADSLDWQNQKSKKLNERYDFSVAGARANWAINLAGRGFALEPKTKQPRRGVYAIAYTCAAENQITDINEVEVRLRAMLGDLDRRLDDIRNRVGALESRIDSRDSLSYQTSFGGGVGYNGLVFKSESFHLPTINLSFVFTKPDRRWEVNLAGGWILTPSDEVFTNKVKTSVSAELAFFLKNGRLGLATGAKGFWEVTRETDEYLSRAYGPFAGVRVRLPGSLTLGADYHYLNHSWLGDAGSKWRSGFSPSVRLTYIFH